MATDSPTTMQRPTTPQTEAPGRPGTGPAARTVDGSGWRRFLTWALAAVWLLDAGLQYQSYMFTTAFPLEVIKPTADGNPAWVHGPVDWSASMMAHHIVLLNATFATVQLLIAGGLIWRRTVKFTLAGSIVWALAVWWLGEGLGGILTGPVSPLMGLPGAVVLYAVIAVLLWPTRSGSSPRTSRRSIATASPLHTSGATLIWLTLWTGFAVETLLPANRAPGAIGDMVAGMADGEPHWLGSINTWAAGLLAGRGLGVSIALAACFFLIALCVLVPSLTKPGLILAVALSLAIWVIAQDFGTLFTAHATDPNSGLLVALLALCYWPATRRAPQSDDDQHPN